MGKKETSELASVADRMGRFIGQLRVHEGISLHQLSHGLCTVSYLNKVENGEREVGKQLTDAFFQRLGKPVEMFERILDWDEFQQWKKRQEIISHLKNGNVEQVQVCATAYRETASGVLDQQFLEIVEIDCLALTGASPQELLPLVNAALKLTHPNFGTVPVESLLLSQNEGRLLFAHLQLREKLEGFTPVAKEYRALLRYFKQPRYESRERVYLLPYVALRVIESDYMEGRFLAALLLCEDTLEELTNEQRLFAYDQFLEWRQKLYDTIGNTDKTPGKLLAQLRLILNYAPKPVELLVSCDERGNVYCLNQVIRDRRKLLGISQEELSDGICAPHTLSRIENNGGKIQRKNRRALLQNVHMSGERYDYEVVTDSYDAYLLRSELDRTTKSKQWTSAQVLFEKLKQQVVDTPTNRQYLLKNEVNMRAFLPDEHSEKITQEERVRRIHDALNLTLPLDFTAIDVWSPCVLSINENLLLLTLSDCYEKMKLFEKSLSILLFQKHCLENSGANISLYEDLYTKVEISIASVLGSLGRYHESSIIVSECLELSVKNQHSASLARGLLGKAWNMLQQAEKLPLNKQVQAKENILCVLRQAYVAALISGDVVRQRIVPAYCRRVLNIELAI